MPRYIDADNLVDFKFAYITKERYKDGRRKSEEEIYAYKVGYNEAIDNIIQFAATANVVEVVRCKDCKYWKTVGACVKKFCTRIVNTEVMKDEDDYCSLGERKEDGTKQDCTT